MPICSTFSFGNYLLVELCKFSVHLLLLISRTVFVVLHMCLKCLNKA